MAIGEELVSQYGFSGAYNSVKRFVRRRRGTRASEAHPVIVTAPGEDYGKFRVMVRNGGDPSFDSESPPRASHIAPTEPRATR